MAAYETYETDATYDDMEGNPSAERVKFPLPVYAFSSNDFL